MCLVEPPPTPRGRARAAFARAARIDPSQAERRHRAGLEPRRSRTRSGGAMLALRAPPLATLAASARRSRDHRQRATRRRTRRRATSRCSAGRSRQRARHVPPSACPSRIPRASLRHVPRGERRSRSTGSGRSLTPEFRATASGEPCLEMRLTVRTIGLLLAALGAWGALVPFVGPEFEYPFPAGSDVGAWEWSDTAAAFIASRDRCVLRRHDSAWNAGDGANRTRHRGARRPCGRRVVRARR